MSSAEVYKVVEIDGKGLGCIATKDIKQGDLILRERPQLIPGSIKAAADFESTESSILRAYFSMSKDNQKEFMQLSTHRPNVALALEQSDMPEECKRILLIYKTNSFSDGLGIKASRFNHSCCSNAMSLYSGASFGKISIS